MTCPLLYRFRTIDQLPEPPSLDALKGTLVHSVLEQLFDLPRGERLLSSAQAMVEPAWNAIVDSDPELKELFGLDSSALAEFFASASELLRRYFTLEDPARLDPKDRELHVETLLDNGLTIHGYIDRLDQAPDGALRIVDYKTGKAPAEGWESKAFFQMKFYALVLWRGYGQIPKLLQLMYLGDETILRYEPDEKDLLATERKISAIWTAIKQSYQKREWTPKKSALCNWCNHQNLCPEFGGTPPPLPETYEITD